MIERLATALCCWRSPRRLRVRLPAAAQTTSPRPTSSGCRIRSTRRATTCPVFAARDQATCRPAADRARRSARRGRLPQGEAAQGRLVSRADYTDVRDRLQDRAVPEARGEARRQRHDELAHEQRPGGHGTGSGTGSGGTGGGNGRRLRRRRPTTREPSRRTRAGTQRSPGRPGDRRAPRARAELRHGAGRGSLRRRRPWSICIRATTC